METNQNITRLLEMLESPEAYSEQEIHDIIDHDDETREAYRLMVAARQGYAHRSTQPATDTEAAWRRFEARHLGARPLATATETRLGARMPLYKLAATIVALLMLSAMAYATIRMVRRYQQAETARTAVPAAAVAHSSAPAASPALPQDTVAARPVVFDNAPLGEMLATIAAHYDVQVTFLNDEARQLRFRFVWNPQQGIDQVVSDLSHFERLAVAMKERQITIDLLPGDGRQ